MKCESENEKKIILWLTEEKDNEAYLSANIQYLDELPGETVIIPNSTMYMTCESPLIYTEEEDFYISCYAADGIWEKYEIYKVNLTDGSEGYEKIKSCKLVYDTKAESSEDSYNISCE